MDHVHEVERFIFSHQFGFSALPMGWWSNGEDGLTEESLKTMSRYRNFTTICCAAVFALGLGACGGGSDDGLSATEEAALRQQVADAEAAKQKAEDDKAAAEAAKKKAEDDAAAAKKKADDEAAAMKMAEMIATAAKLYDGISMPMGDTSNPAATDRAAAYNAAGTGIEVFIGNGDAAPTPIPLSEDKKTMVADNHGWEGKRYADPAGGDMVEAMVYSNVEAPTMGKKFSAEYTLGDDDGMVTIDTAATATPASRVGGSSFDHSSGVKRFPLPSPNPTSQTVVVIPGSYHGVAGTYSCTPDGAVCAANVAAKGFQLGTVPDGTNSTFSPSSTAWTFKPSNAEARVMDSADIMYASYGWWIRKAANDGPFTASAFVDEKGDVAEASGLNALNGKATYMGGAAGKYALSSSTGGTNDAGHFTARAMLEANFTTNTSTDTTTNAITGMIDMFMGADGMPRDWSVKLNGSPIADDGEISDTSNGTVWTIGEDAAKASGNWTGSLRNNGTDGVPQVATGTFYTEYGTAGKMVGAFGANVQ